jgi:hypothetical protein
MRPLEFAALSRYRCKDVPYWRGSLAMDDHFMNEFIAHENIARFKAMLIAEGDSVRQKKVRALLADEEREAR